MCCCKHSMIVMYNAWWILWRNEFLKNSFYIRKSSSLQFWPDYDRHAFFLFLVWKTTDFSIGDFSILFLSHTGKPRSCEWLQFFFFFHNPFWWVWTNLFLSQFLLTAEFCTDFLCIQNLDKLIIMFFYSCSVQSPNFHKQLTDDHFPPLTTGITCSTF